MAGGNLLEGLNLVKKGINVGQTISETLFPQTKPMFKDYWSGDIAKGVVNDEDGIFTSNFWTGDTTVFRSGGKKFYLKGKNPIMIVKKGGKQIGFAHVRDFFNGGLGTNKIYKSIADIKKVYGNDLMGKGIDIHKAIGKLPKPKAGWTPSSYKYMGPYYPLDKQLSYDPKTGEVLEWKVKPYNKVDEIAAYHDICYDMGRNKGECDREMVKSLDEIPYGEMPKWGQTARFLINTKQKLGMGAKNVKRR